MKKFFRIFWLILLGVVVLGTFYFLWSKSRPKTTTYETVEVTRQTIENLSVATGKVSPRDEVMIKPQISGIISELHKEAGQYVESGEIIATVKVIPEMGQLNSAESRVRLAEINLNQTKNEYERQQQLFEQKIISREEMEQSEVTYQRAVEELENAQDNLEIVRDGISSRSAQLSNTQIRSTISGMILDIPVKEGNSVIQSNTFNDGTTIATVADMSDMIFVGTIDETEVGRVHTGMPIKLTIGALESQPFEAILEYISPKASEQNGAILFEIKAAAQIPDSVTVRAGYSANAEIVLSRADNVLSLPESTLSFRGDSTFVYILSDSLATPPVYSEHPVTIGLSDGINVEIRSGLELGEKVRGNVIAVN
ncbi:MAG: efflux RND transporter periplasmic adaptor subunit [Rikenellaceae bacterium]|jgi:HlyD family secretion protein|nr:efflux RND transporter periplasmic adaptor subunit [Rikenellaceae bacterium]MDR0955299.1 efflux RND transporter periplasmic adaptor subunit [Rikenellaceae bacterium]